KIELDVPALRETAIRELYGMNITHATLFPDVDGLARSMAYELEYHWAFDPRTMQPRPGFPPPTDLWFWDDESSKSGSSNGAASSRRYARRRATGAGRP